MLLALELTDFRNYAALEWEVRPGLNVIYGPNAQGKSNLLEAVFLLATTRSWRAGADRELVRWSAEGVAPFARARARVERGGAQLELEAVVTPEGNQARKRFKVDGVPRRPMDVVGKLPAVLFSPEDLDLISGPPEVRRRDLGNLIAQVDRRAFQALGRYTRVLTQRNALLRQIREGTAEPDQLDYWDEQLIADGAVLMAARARCAAALRPLLAARYAEISAAGEAAALEYVPNVPFDPAGEGEPRRSLARQLAAQRSRELAAGLSLCGPHRDDLRFLIDGRDIQAHGSRGQQRSATLAYKLAGADFLCEEGGSRPLLLLDDVMSELDATRRQRLGALVQGWPQVVMTTTGVDTLGADIVAAASVFTVHSGSLSTVHTPGG